MEHTFVSADIVAHARRFSKARFKESFNWCTISPLATATTRLPLAERGGGSRHEQLQFR